MRSPGEYLRAAELSRQGLSDAAIARTLGIPRSTVRDWRRQAFCEHERRSSGCPRCEAAAFDRPTYAYLFGLYLGDGDIAVHARGVYRLRIFLDERYPGIIDACRDAVTTVAPVRRLVAGVVASRGCVYVSSYWKHWPCVSPQHGAGPKHMRPLELEPWQDEVVREHPEPFLRGLIHSDGCRVRNRVAGREYVRYMFCNHSTQIAALFERACSDAGVRCTRPSWRTVSIARAADTARLDEFVGPKR